MTGRSAAEGTGAVHTLLVLDRFDPADPQSCLTVLHPAECLIKADPADPASTSGPVCGVSWVIAASATGLRCYFAHRDDSDAESLDATALVPGSYPVIALDGPTGYTLAIIE